MKPALDFSILDANTPATTPTDAPKETKQYKTTTAAQNVPQNPPAALQGVQEFKLEISQGIKAGADPYPLLLKAIRAIAAATNDQAYYTIHRDIMQSMGMLEQIPAEWEQDSVNSSLQKLEASRRNIEAAITAHKQWRDGQPIDADTDTGDEYDKRIKKCFGAAYKFLDENKHARTDEDWNKIAGSLSPYVDPLSADLVVAAVSELEREYKEATSEQTVGNANT